MSMMGKIRPPGSAMLGRMQNQVGFWSNNNQVFGPMFNPIPPLFANGEEGGWYDPSDLTSMYQDSAGTIPAAINQPVGKINDKSGRGNHLIQATAAARPTLKALYNKLTKTDQLDDAAWTKVAATVTANSDGTADKLIPTAVLTSHRAEQNPLTVGVSHKLVIRAKAAEYSWVLLQIGGTGAYYNILAGVVGTVAGGATASITPASDAAGYYDCTLTVTNPPANGAFIFVANADGGITFTGDGTSGILIARGDLRTTADFALSIPAYQRVNTTSDYDTVGFPQYLEFDGVDDNLSSAASVDLSGTNKLTTFIGGTKLAASVGYYYVQNASEASAYTNTTVYGTEITTSFKEIPSGTFPQSHVIRQSLDLTQLTVATQITMAINGVVIAGAAGGALSAATNFGNGTLRVGSKAASGWINGRLYQFVIRGAQSTDAQVLATERYVGAKMGVAI